MPHRRRDFLGWLGASTLLAASGAPLQAESSPDRSLASNAPLHPVDDTWDMSWVDRIKGSPRSVFDSPEVNQGGAVWRAVSWRNDYHEVYGVDQGTATTVLVIRHKGIPLVMDDDYWSRFEIGKKLKIKDPRTRKWFESNPVGLSRSKSANDYSDHTIEGFIKAGGIVLACHRALMGFIVEDYQKGDKLTSEQAEAEARKHLLPGVILQPSGIFAVLRAQQAGCSYVLAS